jgi:hypothetical protein
MPGKQQGATGITAFTPIERAVVTATACWSSTTPGEGPIVSTVTAFVRIGFRVFKDAGIERRQTGRARLAGVCRCDVGVQ